VTIKVLEITMTTMAFDTLQFAKKLINAGVPQKQAEVHAEAIAEVVEEKLATKADLKKLEHVTKADLKQLETNLQLQMAKWLIGVSMAQAAIIISCIKFIH